MLLGSDPEIFLQHGDGGSFPAFEFLPTKEKGLKTSQGCKYYLDGFQAECEVKPDEDSTKVVESIGLGYAGIINAARKKDSKAVFSYQTVIDVPLYILDLLPKQFTEFGCMPSFNAYNIAGLSADGTKTPYRFAGGHIHNGCGPQPDSDIENMVKALDNILAVIGVSIFQNLDNPIRRQYYGLVGEYRKPPHGMEYRVLSNAWTFHPQLAYKILELSRKILIAGWRKELGGWKCSQTDLFEAVLANNIDLARSTLSKNKAIVDAFNPDFDIMQPIEQSYPSIKDINKNWGI